MTKQCEHVSAEYASRAVAQSVANNFTTKTGILHVVKRLGVMWIVTCNYFD